MHTTQSLAEWHQARRSVYLCPVHVRQWCKSVVSVCLMLCNVMPEAAYECLVHLFYSVVVVCSRWLLSGD